MYTGAGTIMPISVSGSMYARSSDGLYKRAPDLSIPPQNASASVTTRHLPLNGEG